jgi:TRAP-type C4-dicarboxylate transport system permease small subunit
VAEKPEEIDLKAFARGRRHRNRALGLVLGALSLFFAITVVKLGVQAAHRQESQQHAG